jgi:hypothetical protein
MKLPPGPVGPRRAVRFGINQRDVKVAKLRRGLPLRAARLRLIGQGAPDPDRDVGRRPGASRWRSGRTTRPNGSNGSPTSAPARTRRSRLTHRKARSCHSRKIYPRGVVEQSPTGAGILPPATSKDGPDPAIRYVAVRRFETSLRRLKRSNTGRSSRGKNRSGQSRWSNPSRMLAAVKPLNARPSFAPTTQLGIAMLCGAVPPAW